MQSPTIEDVGGTHGRVFDPLHFDERRAALGIFFGFAGLKPLGSRL